MGQRRGATLGGVDEQLERLARDHPDYRFDLGSSEGGFSAVVIRAGLDQRAAHFPKGSSPAEALRHAIDKTKGPAVASLATAP